MAVVYPSKISVFLIADALRNEIGGKATIMGAYAGGQILITPGGSFPATLPLAIYAVFEDGVGSFTPRLRISDPSGQPLAGDFSLPKIEKLQGQPMQLMINFNVFQFPVSGTYTVTITLDEHVYTESISIRVSDKPIS